jgi:hypothetical protein
MFKNLDMVQILRLFFVVKFNNTGNKVNNTGNYKEQENSLSYVG